MNLGEYGPRKRRNSPSLTLPPDATSGRYHLVRSARLTSVYSSDDILVLQQPLESAEGIFPRISQIAEKMVNRVLRSPKPATISRLEHAVTHAVAEILTSMKEIVESIHSIQLETIYLVLPNSIFRCKSKYSHWFESGAAISNLKTFGHHYLLSHQAAMEEFYGIGNCPDIPVDWYTSVPDLRCEEYKGRRIRTVLSIDYSTSNLNLMLLPREEGFFFPYLSTLVECFDLGATSVLRKNDPDGYRAAVKEGLRAITRTAEAPYKFPGTARRPSHRPGVLENCGEVFRLNGDIRKEDYLRTSTDHLFATARAAATEAGVGMMTGFYLCIGSDWCPQGEEAIPEGWRYIKVESNETDNLTEQLWRLNQEH